VQWAPRAESTRASALGRNQIFVSYLNYVYKIDPANGIAAWHYPEKSNVKQVFYAPALIDGEFIYVGDFANDFLKINVSEHPRSTGPSQKPRAGIREKQRKMVTLSLFLMRIAIFTQSM
jgi:hypothetical protein